MATGGPWAPWSAHGPGPGPGAGPGAGCQDGPGRGIGGGAAGPGPGPGAGPMCAWTQGAQGPPVAMYFQKKGMEISYILNKIFKTL